MPIPIPIRFDEIWFQIDAPAELYPSVEAAVRTILPNARFGPGRVLRIRAAGGFGRPIQCRVALEGGQSWELEDSEILSPIYRPADVAQRIKERARLGVLQVISAAYDIPLSPWGILTGVRPTKLVHNLLDRGFSLAEVKTQLRDVYGVAQERADLVVRIAQGQRQFFHHSPNQPVGVYVGIPFCPTRCSYCSFAAYPVTTHGHLMAQFHEALCAEIEAVGRLLKRLGVAVESVYIGGGTPTTYQSRDLRALLELVRRWFVSESTVEFTVEAGRPETILPETCQIMAEAGVKRVSVNPQTMHDATLERVGRAHTAADTRRAVELVRQAGIPIVNMDIILGLPREGLSHVEATLDAIGGLAPENLTVHSLAMKRASALRRSIKESAIAQEQGEAMAAAALKRATAWGLSPYYLYRQRFILSDLENIGFARPHTESIYNVQMMEERQTIIALGGGGITKLVSPDLSLVRLANPKCPATYAQRLRTGLPAKLWQIHEHFAV